MNPLNLVDLLYLGDFFLQGYGLTSHCVVILVGTLIHTSHDHLFFYMLWAVFGGLSTLKMVSYKITLFFASFIVTGMFTLNWV